eukprot:TRINITY_DN1116_c0_g1_i1.p1 TRINITY_DN1116_c0_g1~~TRINITY_DN1116_c0_g1_i1.p1  ORF type:complete len:313 (+),score=15.30 TRINITY_DN1116_c0_g1_i1:128-1066(+)
MVGVTAAVHTLLKSIFLPSDSMKLGTFHVLRGAILFGIGIYVVATSEIQMQGPPGAYTMSGDCSCSISMTSYSNGGWGSTSQYVHGVFTALIKLPGPYTPGVATTFYLTSQRDGNFWDEIDFELLGAQYPLKYLIHTNYHAGDQGSHEEQFTVWFDPTSTPHNYTIIWSWNSVVWMVDGIPIRRENLNPNNKTTDAVNNMLQPSNVQASIWDASTWATDCGATKANYQFAPFTAYYDSIDFSNACVFNGPNTPCLDQSNSGLYSWNSPLPRHQELLMKAYRKRNLHYSFRWRQGPCTSKKGHHPPGVGHHHA